MLLLIEKKDLFRMPDEYYLVHCISSDCALGAGIAVMFEKLFDLRKELLGIDKSMRKHPTCLKVGKVYNLITKKYYYNKPTINDLEISLEKLKGMIIKDDVKKIAMPKIGCGLDRLCWSDVENIIVKVFKNVDVEITVCYI